MRLHKWFATTAVAVLSTFVWADTAQAAAPTISNLSIPSGAVGASVTITGTNFGTSQGTSTVKFNGTTATATSWGTSSIVVTVPTGATTGNVVVTVSNKASNGFAFTVVPAPSISTLSTNTGAVGAAVTITGTNFGTSQGTGSVTFNGTGATVTSWNATTIGVTVPSGATTGNVVVNASGVASSGKSFTVTPNITSLSINAGVVGSAVTITGTTFGTTGTVTFNGTTASTTSWSSTSIATTVPSGATTGNLVVTVGGISSSGVSFTVTPYIASLSINPGAVGAPVTINGTTFGTTGTVTFNGTVASVTSWTSTSIAVTVPSGATTGNVVVTTGGVASNGYAFTVVQAPNITAISVNTGAVGAAVTLTGTGFGTSQGTSTVKFNGTTATATSWTSTSIALTVPSGATSGNVVVNASGIASNGMAFIVVPAPSIAGLSLTSGPVGSPITITGTNFGATQGTVSFNGTGATPTSWSATSIAVTVPNGATTGNVVVNASGVASNGINFIVSTLPAGWLDQDIGSVETAGTANYSNGVFTIQGTGSGFLGGSTTDAFHLAYQTLTGDGSIVGRIASISGGQAAVMFRETLGTSATTMSIGTWAGNLLLYRTTTGSAMVGVSAAGGIPYWFKVTRSGSTFTGYVAADGVNWVKVSTSQTINMAQTIYVGLGATNGNGSLSTVTFDGVSINSNANPSPVITSVSATTGSIGSQVIITGQNFGATQGISSVLLHGAATTINSWSATSITITIPTGATSGYLVVSVAPSMNDSNPVSFTITSNPLPAGWLDQDIGTVQTPGTATYSNGVFTVQGSGGGFVGGTTADSLHFAYQTLTGDGTVVARIASISGGQAAVMVRETLDPGATTVSSGRWTGNLLLYRTTTGSAMASASVSGSIPYWFKVVRSGSTFTGYVAADGVNWVKVGASQTINMAQTIYVGLGVSSQRGSLSTVTFDGVTLNSSVNSGPVITSVSATTGSIGSQVVISGQNFGATQGNSSVLLSGAATTINSWSATSITITIPAGASTGYLIVSVAPGMDDSNAIDFTITNNPLPPGWLDQDVGAVGAAGGATYSNGVFTVQGSGNGLLGSETADSFHFVYQALTGDGTISARIASISGGQAGVIVRETLDASATTMTTSNFSANNLVYRTTTGGSTVLVSASGTIPYWFRVTRSGSVFTGYISNDGMTWENVSVSQSINMAQTIYIGFGASSTQPGQLSTATFDNVSQNSIASPAPFISSLSVTDGPVGTQVLISGANFGAAQGNSRVTLNGMATTINSWSATSITITIPTGATSGNLVVTVAPGMNNSNPVEFTVTSNPLPPGWLDQDVGYVGQVGSSTYSNGVFSITAGGNGDINQDGYHFDYRVLSGDATIIARVNGNSGWPGIMMRESLSSGAKSIYLRGSNGALLLSRNISGGSIAQVPGGTAGNWVKLVRTGTDFVGYSSPDGVNWTVVGGTVPISMAQSIYVGLAMTSVNVGNSYTATFDNVSVSSSTNPAPVITSLSATTGPVGTQVIINGSGFGTSQETSTITLNNMPVTIGLWSDTSVATTIPAGATSGNLVVVRGPTMDTSNPMVFTVTTLPIPSGWFDQDIGLVCVTGSATYSGGIFTINGADHCAGSADALHFVYQPIATDFTIVARVTSLSSFARAGVMVRQTLDPNSPAVSTVTSPAGTPPYSVEFDYRNLYGIPPTSTWTAGSMPGWVKLTRVANAFSGFYSVDGANWTQLGTTQTIPTTQTVFVGLASTAFGGSAIATSTIDNVSLTLGAAEPNPVISGVLPNSGGPGSIITISGSGFGATQGASTVNFNGVAASIISSWSDTQIQAAVPDSATTGPVSVVVGNILGNGPTFTVAFPATITDSLGNQTTYNSGLFGGQWSFTNAQGSGCSSCTVRGNTQNQYDNKGHLLWTIDPLGHGVVYQSDTSGNVISQQVQGDTTTPTATTYYTYDGFGQVATVTDALRNVTTNQYDPVNGNLLSVTTPAPNTGTAASVTQFGYNPLGELTTITDPLHNVTTLTYTPVGLIATITDMQGNVTTYDYDPHGNRTSVTDALHHQTTFAYDAGDRLKLITYPDSTTTGFGYDYRGRRISVTDQNGKITTYAYDDADRLISVTDAAIPPNVTTYVYDTENNLTSISDANQNQTVFNYDEFGRVKQTNFPSSQIETYRYDANNNLISKTDRKNQTIQYIYDVLNRLTRKIYPDSTEADYVYDLVGKIQQVNDPTGTYAFAYDNMGRLIGTTTNYSFLPGKTFTNGYSYDAASNRTGFTDPETGSTTYAYDTLNRLQTLTPPAAISGGSFGFSYDALSRRTQMTRPNSVTTNYGYDNLSHLLSVLHQVSGSTIDGASYTVDSAGNRTAKTDQRLALTTNYGYDSIYQLLSATQSGSTTENYTYDPVGNRLSSLGVASYSNNTSNELTATSNATYGYDLNGNATTKNNSTGITTYAWDFENRMTSVTLPGTSGTVTFKYDPFGRRIYKSSSTATSVYAYDGDNIIEETNAAGGVVARYSQGLNIDEPLAMLRSSATSFYHADGLGSVTSLSSGAGSLAQTYTFDSFGKQTASTGSLVNPFQYTGRESDSETGLYYYRARYYDQSAGRFLSEDPLRFSGGRDFYAYALNSPSNFADPTGLKTQVCCRPLRRIVGYLGINHCYVKITPDGGGPSHTYGLHREDSKNVLYPGGAKPVMDDPTDKGGSCADVPDATPCKERSFSQGFDKEANCPSCGKNYFFTTTNSNYWVSNTLSGFGMTPPAFPGGDNAPGYGPTSPGISGKDK
jgi:RHS repeat-associated protein